MFAAYAGADTVGIIIILGFREANKKTPSSKLFESSAWPAVPSCYAMIGQSQLEGEGFSKHSFIKELEFVQQGTL